MNNKFIIALFCSALLSGCGEKPEENASKSPAENATGTSDETLQLDENDRVEVPQDGYSQPVIEQQKPEDQYATDSDETSVESMESEEQMAADAAADSSEYDSSMNEEGAEQDENSDEIASEPEEESAASEYVVQPGDTLSKIARSHDTTVAALMDANDLASADLIYVGKKLQIK